MIRIVGILALSLTFIGGPSALWAAEKKSSKLSEEDQALKKAQEVLNQTEWVIELLPAGSGKKTVKDTLQFQEGKVTSKEASSDGFPASNYTLSIVDGGTPVWETMQTGKDSAVAFWRGEIHGDTMRGIYSRHPKDKPAVDMSFSGKFLGKLAAPPSKEEIKASSPVVEPTSVVEETSASKESSRKKK